MSFEEIYALLMRLLALLGIVQGELRNASQETVPYSTEITTKAVYSGISDPVVGLVSAQEERVAIFEAVNLLQINTASPHPATLTDILAAFGTIPVYTLPETPPPGYGGTVFGDVISWQMCALD